jgi:2-methylcitrate dehydratase PrpD
MRTYTETCKDGLARAMTQANRTTPQAPEGGPQRRRGPTFLERWADLVLGLDELAPESLTAAADRVLDLCGAAIAGMLEPTAANMRRYIVETAGSGRSALILESTRVPAPQAALANAFAGHCLELDDGIKLAGGHPGVVVIPAALATATSASGEEALRAIVLGYEVFARIGAALNPSHVKRGFHLTATVGPLAAATAAGVMRGLDRDQLVSALGLAVLQGAGLLEAFAGGGEGKPFQVARAASAGVLAVELAQRGIGGPPGALDGRHGFMRAVGEEGAVDLLGADAPARWAIEDVYTKLHGACRHAHTAIDAALELRAHRDHSSRDIEEIVVRTNSTAMQVVGAAGHPRHTEQARFSLPYLVAVALVKGDVGVGAFNPGTLADPAVAELAARVRGEVEPEFDRDYPASRRAELDVRLRGGERVTIRQEVAWGDPELPLTAQQLEEKFRRNVEPALGDTPATELLEAILALPQTDCTAVLDRLACRPQGAVVRS